MKTYSLVFYTDFFKITCLKILDTNDIEGQKLTGWVTVILSNVTMDTPISFYQGFLPQPQANC